MATPNIVPRSDSEGGLGTASKYWASAYIDNVFVSKIGRDADNLLDFSTDNKIKFRVGATNELNLDNNALYPESNDGVGLGYNTNAWSDLFLASGAVINFDNGNVVLTHSNNHLTLADNDILGFGNASDLSIKHTDTAGYIQNVKGHLYINQIADDKDIIFQSDDGSGSYVPYITLDGSEVETKFNKDLRIIDNEKLILGTGNDLEVFSLGQDVLFRFWSGNATFTNYSNDADIIFQNDDGSGGTLEYFRLDGGNVNMITSVNNVFVDNKKAIFGDSADLEIYHNGTDSYVKNGNNGGDLYIRNDVNDKDIVFVNDDGAGNTATYFYLDGSSATHDGSATTNLFTNWPDKSTISLGTSHDFKIQHNGSNTELTNSEGNLVFIQHKDGHDITFQCDDGSGGVAEYLRLDGSEAQNRFFKNVKFDDNVEARFGTGNDLKLYHDGSNSYILNNTGILEIKQETNDGDIKFKADNGSGGTATYVVIDGGATKTLFYKNTEHQDNIKAQFGESGDLNIYHDSTDSFVVNDTGDLYIRNTVDDKNIIFQSDNGSGGVATYFKLDGGSTNTIFEQNARFLDTIELRFGTSNDLKMYHDGTNSEIVNLTGNLNIKNTADQKDIIFFGDDGSTGTTAYLTLDGGNVSTIVNTIKVLMPNLPTSDPSVAGQLWNDNGTLKISAG